MLLWYLNGIEVPDPVSIIYCIYPHGLLGGQFSGCIEEEFSLCMCLLRLQAFFAQVGILSLLQLPGLEIDPLQQSGKTIATDCFHPYVILTLALDSLCLLKT